MKTVFIGCFLVGGGTPFFQQGQLLAEAPPCPHLSLTPARLLPEVCGHLLVTWGAGNHLGGQDLGLSRSPGPRAAPTSPR